MLINTGVIDRIIRIVVGLVLLSLLFVVKSDLHRFFLLGLLPLLTGLTGHCPLYTLVEINTCAARK